MNNDEILNKITELHENRKKETGNPEASSQQNVLRFLAFSVAKTTYALFADQVREVLMDSQIFFMPFVPNYVRGLINRHGEPYTVLDINILFKGKSQDSSKFLVMNSEGDSFAFLINDVIEILDIPEPNLCLIEGKDPQDEFFLGSFTHDEQEIFVIDIKEIMRRLENDLE